MRQPARRGIPCVFLTALASPWGAWPVFADQHGNGAPPSIDLTLEDSILLALRNNRTLIRSQFSRAAERFSLRVAENAFKPRITVGLTLGWMRSRLRGESRSAGLASTVKADALLVPIAAVEFGNGRPQVRVKGKDSGAVRLVDVVTGITTLNAVEILENIAPGGEIVVAER